MQIYDTHPEVLMLAHFRNGTLHQSPLFTLRVVLADNGIHHSVEIATYGPGDYERLLQKLFDLSLTHYVTSISVDHEIMFYQYDTDAHMMEPRVSGFTLAVEPSKNHQTNITSEFMDAILVLISGREA